MKIVEIPEGGWLGYYLISPENGTHGFDGVGGIMVHRDLGFLRIVIVSCLSLVRFVRGVPDIHLSMYYLGVNRQL